MNTPRIRCSSFQAESDDKKYNGKWFFVLSVWDFIGETMTYEHQPIGPFETQKEAIEESKRAARIVSEMFEKEFTGQIGGQYLDLKNGGILRSWNEN